MAFFAKRIAGDIRLLTNSKSRGIEFDFSHNDKNLDKVYAAIYGPEGSCFNSCIFYFIIDCSQSYPIKPPIFKFVTPIHKRFHPNLYADGKVCLTILNTWHDSKVSGWTAATNLEAVLTTIRSMIHDNPLSEEPGQDYPLTNNNAKNYHIAAKYYSLENTFSYFLNNPGIPDNIYKEMGKYFMAHISTYKNSIKELNKYDGNNITYFHGTVTISIKLLKSMFKKVKKNLSE